MLGALLFLGALGISGMKATYDDYEMKKISQRVDEKGNVHYYDRQCRDYINGERVQRVETQDPNGVTLYSTVGMTTNKVYDTSYGRGMQQLLAMSESNKQDEIKRGRLAYSQFNPYFGQFVTTEIATGRTITCLFAGENKKTGECFYKKWYYRPECQGKYDYRNTVDGDYGIDITQEEYQKLNIRCGGSHRNIPSDYSVSTKLLGYD